jgi:uncharacterized membrane protein
MTEHPRSTANIGGHPIHPMLVPFPIVFLVSTLLCDLAFWRTQGEVWALASMWLLGAGLVTGALAAVAGLTDFAGSPRIRALNDAWLHMIGNVVAVVLSIVSFYMRWRYGAAAAVMPWGLLISAVVFGLLLFNGWKGGELVFRHGVGVLDDAERHAPGVTGADKFHEIPRRPTPAE